VANPYRLRPYLGARVALDHIFTSVLYMYNPHESPLQVLYIRLFLWYNPLIPQSLVIFFLQVIELLKYVYDCINGIIFWLTSCLFPFS
jgi:hypothetical protein